MLVRNWMSPDPLTIEPSATVGEARGLLQRYGIHHLPVAHRATSWGLSATEMSTATACASTSQ